MPRRNKKRGPKKYPSVTVSQSQSSISGMSPPLSRTTSSNGTTTASQHRATSVSSVITVPPRKTASFDSTPGTTTTTSSAIIAPPGRITRSCSTKTASHPGVTPASSRVYMSSVIVVPPSRTNTSCTTTTITDSRINLNRQYGTTTPSSTVATRSVIILPPSRTVTDFRTNSGIQHRVTAPTSTVPMRSTNIVPPSRSTGTYSTNTTDSSSQHGANAHLSTYPLRSVILVPPRTPTGAWHAHRFSARIMPRCTIPIVIVAKPATVIGPMIVHKEQTTRSCSIHPSAAGISPRVAVPVITSANTPHPIRSRGAVISPINPVRQAQMMPFRHLSGQHFAQSHSHRPTLESPTSSRYFHNKPRNLGPDRGGLAAGDYDQMAIGTVPNPARESSPSHDSSWTTSN